MSTPAAAVKERPEWLSGPTIKAVCGCGSIYITINELNGEPFEVFIHAGKNGMCTNTTLGAIGFIFSDMLQDGVPLEKYAKRLVGFECERKITRVEGKGRAAYSCVDVIAKTLLDYFNSRGSSTPATGPAAGLGGAVGDEMPHEGLPTGSSSSVKKAAIPSGSGTLDAPRVSVRTTGQPAKGVEEPVDVRGKRCQECGGMIVHEGGCDHCLACGLSENCE
jgi:hypothetical protein